MKESRGVWFVVATGRHVRLIVNESGTGKFWTVGDAVPALEGAKILEPQDPRFGWLVAKQLNDACARNLMDSLVLIAPQRLRRNIREGLDPAVSARIVGEVSENLGGYEDHVLFKRLAQIPLRVLAGSSRTGVEDN